MNFSPWRGPILRAALLAAASAGLFWATSISGFHAGRIQDEAAVGETLLYARMEAPFRTPVSLVVERALAERKGLEVGRYALAHGESIPIENAVAVKVDALWVAPFATPDVFNLPELRALDLGLTGTVMAALIVMTLGGWAIQVLAQAALTSAFAGAVWMAVAVAGQRGWIVDPSNSAQAAIAAAFGLALLFAIGFSTPQARLLYRAAAAAALYLALPAIAAELQISEVAARACVALALAFPTLTPALIGATLLCHALHPQDPAARCAIVAGAVALTLLARAGLAAPRPGEAVPRFARFARRPRPT